MYIAVYNMYSNKMQIGVYNMYRSKSYDHNITNAKREEITFNCC